MLRLNHSPRYDDIDIMGVMSKYFWPLPRSLQVDAGVMEGLKQLVAIMTQQRGQQRGWWEIVSSQIDSLIGWVCTQDDCGEWGMTHDVQYVTWLEQRSSSWLPQLAHKRRSICACYMPQSDLYRSLICSLSPTRSCFSSSYLQSWFKALIKLSWVDMTWIIEPESFPKELQRGEVASS